MHADVQSWLSEHVVAAGAPQLTHARPWAAVWRVPVTGGQVWFKQCAAVQAFEPRLTDLLAARSPHLLPEVVAHDNSRGWLLVADAGESARQLGNPPELWLDALPLYAELQRQQAPNADDHLSAGVPDLRPELLPSRFPKLLDRDLPLDQTQRSIIGGLEPTFTRWCTTLAQHGIPASVQHDDLHYNNLYSRHGQPRIIDWGDSLIAHPFTSLAVTSKFLAETHKLPPGHRWLGRLRDAYLEPWGTGHRAAFALALRVGTVAHAIAWTRQREALPAPWRPRFDISYRDLLAQVTRLALNAHYRERRIRA